MLEISYSTTEEIGSLINSYLSNSLVSKGIMEVLRTLERDNAKFIVVASDVEPKRLTNVLLYEANKRGVKIYWVKSKYDLGEIANIETIASAIAIRKQ